MSDASTAPTMVKQARRGKSVASDHPILFLVFNRPAVTRTVFEQLRRIKPKRLFIAADGPRAHVEGEAQRCAEVREIFDNIDWDCQVERRFADSNQGCAKGVSSAITWFFQHVEAGIILEDDCLPDPTFFAFCNELLDLYANDQRVMLISGDNFQDGEVRGDGSYYFSRLAHIWGWATWRRTWQKFDLDLADVHAYHAAIRALHPSTKVHENLGALLEKVHRKEMDTWGFPLLFSVLKHRGLCINPNVNLVTNIGFGSDATHTIDEASKQANLPRGAMDRLVHPSRISADTSADEYSLKHVFGIDTAIVGKPNTSIWAQLSPARLFASIRR